jgi:hypothetical protein
MAAASEPWHGSATNVVDRLIKPLRLRRESSQDPPRRAFSPRSHDPKRPKLEIPSENSHDVAFWKQSDQGPKFAAIDEYDMAGKLIARKVCPQAGHDLRIANSKLDQGKIRCAYLAGRRR